MKMNLIEYMTKSKEMLTQQLTFHHTETFNCQPQHINS